VIIVGWIKSWVKGWIKSCGGRGIGHLLEVAKRKEKEGVRWKKRPSDLVRIGQLASFSIIMCGFFHFFSFSFLFFFFFFFFSSFEL